jgi:hypothetical protein
LKIKNSLSKHRVRQEFKVNKEDSRVFYILNMTPNGFQIEILGKGNIIIKLTEPLKDRKKCLYRKFLSKNIIKLPGPVGAG